MMWRPALLMVPLLLGACNAGPQIAAAPLTPQEQACATQADQDPELRAARGIAAGQLEWQYQHAPEMEQVKRDAITRCLKARGLMPRGGVERAR
jgi:hypothetical protein